MKETTGITSGRKGWKAEVDEEFCVENRAENARLADAILAAPFLHVQYDFLRKKKG